MPRIDAPSPPYDPEIAASLERWMPPGSDLEVPLIFRAFHVHADLASRAHPLAAGLLTHGRLPARDRELVVDRVTGRHGAEHEWGLHASVFGAAVGFSEDQLASTVTGPQGSRDLWSEAELELFDVVDELCDRADLSPEGWATLRARYEDEQLVELLVLVGWYRTVSSICNVLELEPEPWTARFPAPAHG